MPISASIRSDLTPRLRRSRTRSLSLPAAMRCLTLLLRTVRGALFSIAGLKEIHHGFGELARAAPGRRRDQMHRTLVAQTAHNILGARLGLLIRQQVALVDH